MANINVIQARPFQLAEPIGTTETEITVKNLFDIYGNPIVMSGDIQFSTVEPQSQTNQEIISYTGIVQLTATTAKLTGVTRGLDAQPDPVTGLYGSDPSQAKPHSANAECILSDNPQVWDKKTSKDEEETISEEWTFQKSPIVPTPTQDNQAATKEYADMLAILGSPDASTTAKGISRLSASPNVTLGTVTVTIATPGLFTLATHGLTENDTVQFTTTGDLPTGLLSSVTYYVIAAGLTANDFQVSATYGGIAVATSGSQSGIHTAVKTTPVAVGTNDTRMPTQTENDALVGTEGTPSGTNPFVTDDDTRFLAKPEYFPNNSYPAGETLSAGNVVFIEPAPTTAQATSIINIGNVSAVTRYAITSFGSGVAGSTLKMNFSKTGSPSVSLGVRIEGDNGAGKPNGILVNNKPLIETFTFTPQPSTAYQFTVNGFMAVVMSASNATAGSIADQFVTLWTVNANLIPLATVQRVGDTLVLTSILPLTVSTSVVTTSIISKVQNQALDVSTNATGTVTAASLTTSLADTTVTLGGSITIPAGQKCHIVIYQGTYGSETVNASNYFNVGMSSTNSTTRVHYSWNGSIYNGPYTTPTYTSSTLFSDKVLSKTNADYTYKIDWHGISQEAVTAGDITTGKYPTIALEGVDSNQTGMTQGTTMYLSNTAGAIASSAGTNMKTIGEAITSSKLQIKEVPGTANFTATSYTTSNTGTAEIITTPIFFGNAIVYFELGAYRSNYSGNTYAYLQVSSDGISWSTLTSCAQVGSSSGLTDLKKGNLLIKGQYIRFRFFTDNGTFTSSNYILGNYILNYQNL